jgi:YVTN family beta-propeller protein
VRAPAAENTMRCFVRGARTVALSLLAMAASGTSSAFQSAFVNYESPHVHPLALTPNGAVLLAVNTPDGRLEVFDVLPAQLVHRGSVSVGVDPVSVRARSDTEAWVVNHLSDSISIVDLATLRVVRTLQTGDEPCDVVFAGVARKRAFVTCSAIDTVQVFDLAALGAPPLAIELFGEDPRALAVAANGSKVYAAIFESGNRSTVLGGGSTLGAGFPPNAVGNPAGPYGGVNPPPNDGSAFDPPIKASLPTPPRVALIVKQDAQDRWMDDNDGDWTPLVSGAQSSLSGRPIGWNLPDHDVAILDADTLALSYVDRLMNIVMALAVHPVSGELLVVGTDAMNEIRFEPNLNGVFLRVLGARVPFHGASQSIVDLNPHLDYQSPSVAPAAREKSLGDPRGVAISPLGNRIYVAGMGSSNVAVFDPAWNRAGVQPTKTIEVGAGPTGIVAHPTNGMLFVLNRFDGSISCVDRALEIEIDRTPFSFDPTPTAIREGRAFLYDTHRTSGTGHVACASCHVDARMDRLAWDLGDPQGDVKSITGQNLGVNVPGVETGFEPWHPMKGPMTTQTLQDIIGKEPLHWRGDRDGLEQFNGAFTGLQGDDAPLTASEMQAFEDYLATIHFPPNPHRELENTLPTALDTNQVSPGRFSPKGTPLPPGDAVRGLALFRPPSLLDSGATACASCHTLPIGIGTNSTLSGSSFQPFPIGPNGEQHHLLVSQDGTPNLAIKVPQLRNLYDKVGFDTSQVANRAGFGHLHDGTVDTLATFLAGPVFIPQSDQDLADLVALLLAFAGSDLEYGGSLLEPPATQGQDAHAATGQQETLVDGANPAPGQIARIDRFVALAQTNDVGLVVKGIWNGLPRGFHHSGGMIFQSDRHTETVTITQLLAAATPGAELTFTIVPFVSRVRIGVDRDADGTFDRDELDALTDPDDPLNYPGCGSALAFGAGCAGTGAKAPTLEIDGCLKAGGAMTFALEKARPGSVAVLVFGLAPTAQPIGGGCNLYVAPLLPVTLGPLPLDGSGNLVVDAALPAVAPAATFTLQAFVVDPASPIGVTTTNGLKITIQ